MASRKTALTLALGTAFAASLAAAPVVNAAGDPFEMNSLSGGYQVAQADKNKEGKCGEGKCGGDKAKDGKCGEGKCGGDKKKEEGKCGEGKCGGEKKK
jgi:uncharacterized low-complexity protein